MAVAHGVQAGAVAECVLHLVHPRGDRIAARRGDWPPVGLHRHPARQAAAHQSRRLHGHLVQELLDALGAEQCAVQFPEIFRVGEFRCDVCSCFSRHQHTHLMDTHPAYPGVRLVLELLPVASDSNAGVGRNRSRRVSIDNRVTLDSDKSYRSACDGRCGSLR